MSSTEKSATLLESVLSPDALRRARAEVAESGLLESLRALRDEFLGTVSGETPRGNRYVFGANPEREYLARLYALVRELRPEKLVETGVCNGVSTSFLLLALDRNRSGRLYSIDWPEYAGERRGAEFWAGKGGAVLPPGKEPGWIVPGELRERWELTVGRSQDALEPLLAQLGGIDFFFHDGEHSYECMSFEYRLSFRHLREGGVLASDDTGRNAAWADFAAKASRKAYSLGDGVGALVK